MVELHSKKPRAAWPVEATEAPPWEAALLSLLHDLKLSRAAQLLRRPLPRPLLSNFSHITGSNSILNR